MLPCDHEDTMLVVHLVYALKNGCKTCLIRTVDTDVVVIIIGKFYHLLTLNPSVMIWVAFGRGRNSICDALGQNKSLVMPLCYSFTGCETTSRFCGKGKKLAWEAWMCYPLVKRAFTHMVLED